MLTKGGLWQSRITPIAKSKYSNAIPPHNLHLISSHLTDSHRQIVKTHNYCTLRSTTHIEHVNPAFRILPYGHSAVNFPKVSHHERLCHVDFDGRTYTIVSQFLPHYARLGWCLWWVGCDLWWWFFVIPCFMFVLSFVGRIGNDVFASSDFMLLLHTCECGRYCRCCRFDVSYNAWTILSSCLCVYCVHVKLFAYTYSIGYLRICFEDALDAFLDLATHLQLLWESSHRCLGQSYMQHRPCYCVQQRAFLASRIYSYEHITQACVSTA